jgi:hypothetical protein
MCGRFARRIVRAAIRVRVMLPGGIEGLAVDRLGMLWKIGPDLFGQALVRCIRHVSSLPAALPGGLARGIDTMPQVLEGHFHANPEFGNGVVAGIAQLVELAPRLLLLLFQLGYTPFGLFSKLIIGIGSRRSQ